MKIKNCHQLWEKKCNDSENTGHKEYDLIVKEYQKPSFDPEKDKDKVLVRVKAAAVNPIDCKALVSFKPVADFPRFGRDFAGTVVNIGNSVTDIKVGDEVWGTSAPSMAEYCICPVGNMSKKPVNLSMEEAAGIGVVYVTGYDALFAGSVKERPPVNEDSKVLIIGASGGTGIPGCQLAKHCGNAKLVVGVCSGKNEALVKEAGADCILDYTKVDFKTLTDAPKEEVLAEVKKHLPSGQSVDFDGFDIVYDCVSSPEDYNYRPISQKFLRANGHYVCINSASWFFWARALLAAMIPWLSRVLLPGNEDLFAANINRKKADQLSQWFSEGKLKMNIFETFDFNSENLNSIYDAQMSRRASGKVVVTGI